MFSNPSSPASHLCPTVLGTKSPQPRPTPKAFRRLPLHEGRASSGRPCSASSSRPASTTACSTRVAGGRRLRRGAPGLQLLHRPMTTTTATSGGVKLRSKIGRTVLAIEVCALPCLAGVGSLPCPVAVRCRGRRNTLGKRQGGSQ